MTPSAVRARLARRGAASAVAAVALTACAISQQLEVELGASTAAEVAAQLPLIWDGAVVNYITALGSQLTRATDSPGLSWTFSVVDSREVNAESGASQAAINIGGSALFARFSRSDESEADAEAVATTVKAGISPRGIPAMFQTFLNERKSNPGSLDAFFATHPLEEARITATEALIANYTNAELARLASDTRAFQSFRQGLRALPPSPAPKAR